MKHRVVALVGPPLEMYRVTSASAVFGDHGPDIPTHYDFALCTETPGPVRTTMEVDVIVEHGLEALTTADTVLIPGWCPGPEVSPEVGAAVRAAHSRGARIVAICSGIYVPASLGLLDGRAAATHWELTADLAARYPLIRSDASVLYVDHGDVATAGASATTVDLCLNQVRRDHGAALAMRIGRQLAAAPHREGSQRQFPRLPTTGPVPDSLAPLLDWITARLDQPLTVDHMAARAGLSRRTLTRHFTDQLGVSPGRWLLDRRIASTRALLEETDLPVGAIAQRVGLSSAVNLRRRFRAALDTTPAAYRRSFR
ncbi:GlxA family transcriptional regulator [Actinoplanes regularis]|uniref:Transcriptional regulator GlxA family, contains an amidase domain and an AraC-type DNA-binding HTH domain n=1 Tax=Actinoplanes regularis TaxID=52697 RepID=A0A239DY80_9ACTN|nr:helix-turn-helix domain-containing protein [Actinoplanes regularis]GIE88950.1 AraC family transcriptional regulator [Actinoplanes regularis]SNS37209.1 Transcriptional regulator GlxA family, contains an amidase domain and an AraC-type DNA-binding HTH domain [Actinoplanes regularis]